MNNRAATTAVDTLTDYGHHPRQPDLRPMRLSAAPRHYHDTANKMVVGPPLRDFMLTALRAAARS